MKNFELFIRNMANKLGVDVTRYKDDSADCAKLVKMLSHNNVDMVIDIGANQGQYAKLLRRYGYQGRILSFEPLQDAWNDLQSASSDDDNWDIFPRCAIGDSNSFETINVSGNSVSSSILDMLERHSDSAPESAYIRTEQVQVIPLDDALKSVSDLPENIFIKIDTQGYEEKVLDGASASITRAAGLQIELSLVPLYSGQALFQEILDRLTMSGLGIWSIFPGFTEKSTGRMLQCDAILFKNIPDRSDA